MRILRTQKYSLFRYAGPYFSLFSELSYTRHTCFTLKVFLVSFFSNNPGFWIISNALGLVIFGHSILGFIERKIIVKPEILYIQILLFKQKSLILFQRVIYPSGFTRNTSG